MLNYQEVDQSIYGKNEDFEDCYDKSTEIDSCGGFFHEIEEKEWIKSALEDEVISIEEKTATDEFLSYMHTNNHGDYENVFLPSFSSHEYEKIVQMKRFYILRNCWRYMMNGVVPKFSFSMGNMDWELLKLVIGNEVSPKLRRGFKKIWKLGEREKKRVIRFVFTREKHNGYFLFPWTKKITKTSPRDKLFTKYEYKMKIKEVCLEYLPCLNELVIKGKYEKFYFNTSFKKWFSTA